MAVLEVVQGGDIGTQYPLEGARTVIGRHPNCTVVLRNGAVSRQHAQILEDHGQYALEDLRSRNGCYLNGERIEGRVPLRNGDEIRLCEVVLSFKDLVTEPLPKTDASIPMVVGETVDLSALSGPEGVEDESRIFVLPEAQLPAEDFDSGTSTRRVTAEDSSLSRIDPNVKLRGVLAITRALNRQLGIDEVLPKLLETLFSIFPQTEQGFVLLRDGDSKSARLRLKASRSRGDQEADAVAISMTVVRHALQTKEAILSESVPDDTRFKGSAALSKMRIRSMMCVPLVTQDEEEEGLGVIQIVTRDAKHSFKPDDLDLLVTLASQASMKIVNARLHEEALKRRELERDLEFATQVQLGFLPKSRPDIEGYEFADYYEAAQRVGGDYFDYIRLPNDQLVIAIGDVAGKGIPAALLMARLYSSTRFQVLTQDGLDKAITGLNVEISGTGLGHRFITFLALQLNIKTHEVTIVNAGHLTPILRLKDGTISTLGEGQSNLPLGILPEQQYSMTKATLPPGSTVIAYTDGVSEAMSDSRKIFGRARLEKAVANQSGSVADLIDSIVEEVDEFSGGSALRDDTCLIGFARKDG
ncbi:MAG: SpoIIE family protein phosphatase [Planctomycetaceae bacterium]|nr:SpoIIE family protein phosphatase [Planctomycetaceae bacterium]MCB9951535.1 SpoIIE family protein phosphatase [Planctomycetaceae bacterium]